MEKCKTNKVGLLEYLTKKYSNVIILDSLLLNDNHSMEFSIYNNYKPINIELNETYLN